jgi:DNA-binding SARP family transcriptional activator
LASNNDNSNHITDKKTNPMIAYRSSAVTNHINNRQYQAIARASAALVGDLEQDWYTLQALMRKLNEFPDTQDLMYLYEWLIELRYALDEEWIRVDAAIDEVETAIRRLDSIEPVIQSLEVLLGYV